MFSKYHSDAKNKDIPMNGLPARRDIDVKRLNSAKERAICSTLCRSTSTTFSTV